jgi:hypothetical protein
LLFAFQELFLTRRELVCEIDQFYFEGDQELRAY